MLYIKDIKGDLLGIFYLLTFILTKRQLRQAEFLITELFPYS